MSDRLDFWSDHHIMLRNAVGAHNNPWRYIIAHILLCWLAVGLVIAGGSLLNPLFGTVLGIIPLLWTVLTLPFLLYVFLALPCRVLPNETVVAGITVFAGFCSIWVMLN